MPKFNQRIKVLLFLPLLLGSIFLFFKYSRAQFSDSETVLGNSIQVGTWEITPIVTPETTITPTPTETPSPEIPTSTPTETSLETPTPTNTPTPTPTSTPTPGNLANHIVISEVQINGGPSKADYDFIELYNPTNTIFNLNGHRLVRRTGNSPADTTIKSWTSSALIPAHGFYLWANNSVSDFPSSIGADTSTSFDLTSSHSIALRNGPENTGLIIDALSWNNGSTLGEGDTFSSNLGGGESIERKAYSSSDTNSMTTGLDVAKGNAYDTDNNASDFILRTTPEPQNTSSTPEIP